VDLGASEEMKVRTIREVKLVIFDSIIVSNRMRKVGCAGYAICMRMVRAAYVIVFGRSRYTRNL
jgi:hypothetical protein